MSSWDKNNCYLLGTQDKLTSTLQLFLWPNKNRSVHWSWNQKVCIRRNDKGKITLACGGWIVSHSWNDPFPLPLRIFRRRCMMLTVWQGFPSETVLNLVTRCMLFPKKRNDLGCQLIIFCGSSWNIGTFEYLNLVRGKFFLRHAWGFWSTLPLVTVQKDTQKLFKL